MERSHKASVEEESQLSSKSEEEMVSGPKTPERDVEPPAARSDSSSHASLELDVHEDFYSPLANGARLHSHAIQNDLHALDGTDSAAFATEEIGSGPSETCRSQSELDGEVSGQIDSVQAAFSTGGRQRISQMLHFPRNFATPR